MRVRMLGAGGTIASRRGLRGSSATEPVSTLFGVAGPPPGIELEYEDVVRRGSYALRHADLRVLAERVGHALADPGIDGIVLSHGTDTLEETAFLLDAVHDDPRSLVITGAQSPADSVAPDGPRNLAEAVRLAVAPELRGHGVLIGFAGVAWSARGTAKLHTSAPAPFGGGLPVAEFVGDQVRVLGSPARPAPLARPDRRFDAVRVPVLVSHVGADPDLFAHALERSDAVVLAGTGLGNAGPGIARAIAASHTPVVLATRVPHGPVVPTYADGGGFDLVEAGALSAGVLGPYQARMLIALLIAQGNAGATLRRAFTTLR